MVNSEYINFIEDTIIHKKYMLDSSLKMYKILIKKNKEDLANELIRRAIVHDNSKFNENEATLLASIISKKALTDPLINIGKDEKEIVKKHWKNNRHHPEYFENVEDMTELDIIEMVCDWNARSMQYKTDFVEFVITRQENRFNFPENMFNKILDYCFELEKEKEE